MEYFDHDAAAEIIARMDAYTESEGTEFSVPDGMDKNGSFTEFFMEAKRPDGTVYVFEVQVREYSHLRRVPRAGLISTDGPEWPLTETSNSVHRQREWQ